MDRYETEINKLDAAAEMWAARRDRMPRDSEPWQWFNHQAGAVGDELVELLTTVDQRRTTDRTTADAETRWSVARSTAAGNALVWTRATFGFAGLGLLLMLVAVNWRLGFGAVTLLALFSLVMAGVAFVAAGSYQRRLAELDRETAPVQQAMPNGVSSFTAPLTQLPDSGSR